MSIEELAAYFFPHLTPSTRNSLVVQLLEMHSLPVKDAADSKAQTSATTKK